MSLGLPKNNKNSETLVSGRVGSQTERNWFCHWVWCDCVCKFVWWWCRQCSDSCSMVFVLWSPLALALTGRATRDTATAGSILVGILRRNPKPPQQAMVSGHLNTMKIRFPFGWVSIHIGIVNGVCKNHAKIYLFIYLLFITGYFLFVCTKR